MEVQCIIYLPQFKFSSVWNLTLIIPSCINSDHSKIYYIGFEGIVSKKKQKVPLSFQVEVKNSNKIGGLEEGLNTTEIGQI